MNAQEFKTWFAHHRACFPGIDSWLGKIDAAAKRMSEEPLTSTAVLKRWNLALSDLALADATEASNRMLKGDVEPPKSFDDHPRAIRKAAFAVRGDKRQVNVARTYDGERAYCATCDGDGVVIALHPKTVADIHAGNFDRPRYAMAVRCPCAAGRAKFPGVTIEFQRDIHTRCGFCIGDPEWAELIGQPLVTQQGQAWEPEQSYEDVFGTPGN